MNHRFLYERLRAAGLDELTAHNIVDDVEKDDEGVWIGMLIMSTVMGLSFALLLFVLHRLIVGG